MKEANRLAECVCFLYIDFDDVLYYKYKRRSKERKKTIGHET